MFLCCMSIAQLPLVTAKLIEVVQNGQVSNRRAERTSVSGEPRGIRNRGKIKSEKCTFVRFDYVRAYVRSTYVYVRTYVRIHTYIRTYVRAYVRTYVFEKVGK